MAAAGLMAVPERELSLDFGGGEGGRSFTTSFGVSVPESEFIEINEDGRGSVEWLDEPESLGGGSIRRRRPRIIVVAALVAAVLTATSLILRANHDFGPRPDSRTAVVGSVDWRKTLPGTGAGMWTTSDSVVVATVNGLTAYSLSRGEKLWSWAPPSGQGLCAMSPTTSQGRGVVAYGPLDASNAEVATGLPCTTAQAIDDGTGKAVWGSLST